MIRLLQEKEELELDQFDSAHPKYILDWNDVDDSIVYDEPLYRVIYKDGTEGGKIASYDNLSQEGSCKVLSGGVVLGNAKISGNAQVEYSRIQGNAQIFGNAKVSGGTVFGDAQVYSNAVVNDYNGLIYGNAKIYDNAYISNADIYGNAQVYGKAKIIGQGDSKSELAKVSGNAQVYDNAVIRGKSHIYGKAKVYDDIMLVDSKVGGNAIAHGSGGYSYAKLSGHDDFYNGKIQ